MLRRSVWMAAGAILLTAVAARGDDFWLIPSAFRVAAGDELLLRGQTSSQFPRSRVAVSGDRIADARRLAAQNEVPITSFAVEGRSLLLRDRPSAAGQYVIAIALRPRSVRESAAGFRRYLEAEGATAALRRVDRERLLQGRDSVTRRYAKYAKSLVQVGNHGARAFGRVANHEIEFVPLRDPASLQVGDTLPVRLLFRGAALADIPVHADVAELDADVEAAPAGGYAASDHAGQTLSLIPDRDGLVRLVITRRGMWSLRTVHVTQADAASGADWDTHWGTLVFAAGESPSRGGRP